MLIAYCFKVSINQLSCGIIMLENFLSHCHISSKYEYFNVSLKVENFIISRSPCHHDNKTPCSWSFEEFSIDHNFR